jgi:hypothetical protein
MAAPADETAADAAAAAGSGASSSGDGGESSGTALSPSAGTTVAHPRSHVPPGMRIKWFQRKETILVDIEVPDIEEADVSMEDSGQIELRAKDPRQTCTLQLLRRIHTAKSRWWHSGRYVKLELAKAEYGLGHWDRLIAGDKLPNVLIDWTSWIDEAEETEARRRPGVLPSPRFPFQILSPPLCPPHAHAR